MLSVNVTAMKLSVNGTEMSLEVSREFYCQERNIGQKIRSIQYVSVNVTVIKISVNRSEVMQQSGSREFYCHHSISHGSYVRTLKS